jgi:outer membrane receptor protein involved in Fe transport
MKKSFWLLSAGFMAVAAPAAAQTTGEADATQGQGSAQAPEQEPVPGEETSQDAGDIIVTATRRNQALSDVPIAVSAVSGAQLQASGATDIRQLNQLSPSLLVSSTSSEAGAGVARIRGIGTVGDNPGLESSVALFIDGVYRSRTGVGLTELGAIDRVEVLRGPQGTLFGRNASAGLINIITQRPSFDFGGTAALSYGNYDYMRADVGVTGPITEHVAARLDGVWMKRDGFLTDIISGRKINDRDRYLVRGQLLYEPSSDFTVRLIGDYTKRDEECCGAIYAPLINYARDPATPAGQIGNSSVVPASFATVLRSLRDPAGNPVFINDDINRRQTAITPGRDYRSDVEDWGVSLEVNYDFGGAELTSITGYRDFLLKRGQDADFNNYDILYRDRERRGFETFTQELRLQGEAFDDRLDWLVGAYYADETLELSDNLKFGTQFGQFANITVGLNPALAAFPALGGFANLPGVVNGLLAANPAIPAAARGAIVAQIQPVLLSNVGISRDDFRQKSRNYALFTHNIFEVTDRLNLTLGIRYTNERKTLDASLLSNNQGCASIRGSLTRLSALAAANPGLAPIINAPGTGVLAVLTGLAPIPCVANLNTTVDGQYNGRRSEDEFSGTAVLSFKPTPDLLTYASYSKGYKAGGFNLDRSGLSATAPSAANLQFEPEKVDAFELGAKYNGRLIDINVAAFYQVFDQFQLNTFNGINFLVENIQACSDALGAPPAGSIFGSCDPAKIRGGVTTKGAEIEAFIYPMQDFQISTGVTLVDTKYRERLVGLGGRPLVNDLFLLPGKRLSNSAAAVVTGSVSYNPEISGNGMRALIYTDFRYQSEINTGSDLDIEKRQEGVMVMNARLGLQGPDRRWGVELWAQNLFDVDYSQVYFDAPFQPLGGPPGGRVTNLPRGGTLAADRSTALFGRFLAEPRTYGITVRTRF